MILSIDPGIQKENFGMAVIDETGHPIDLMMVTVTASQPNLAAEQILEKFKEFKCTEIVMEDFVAFTGPGKKVFNGGTVTKMGRLISYLTGYIEARGVKITLYTSATWKRGLKHGEIKGTDAARAYLDEKLGKAHSPKKSQSHEIDAYGIGLYHILREEKNSKKDAKVRRKRLSSK